jgi:elongation factor 1-gamma
LADVAWATTLSVGYKLVFSEKFRKPFVNVNKWLSTVLETAEIVGVLGRNSWCVEEVKANVEIEEEKTVQTKEKKKDKKKAEKKPQEEEKKVPAPESKKVQKEKKEKPKEVPKPASPPPEEDEDKPSQSHNPLDHLSPSSFVIDAWKRLYANTKQKREVISQFWTNYENEGWSLWLLQYQKAEGEGQVLFKTNNLLEGFISRMDHFRRYSFGAMGVYGEEPTLEIKGALLWRGQAVPAELLEHPSFEYYTRIRVDPGNEEQRRLVEDYWCNNQESDFVQGLRVRNWRSFL